MRLRTYFATGVEAALATARQELGPDAMLVHSRRVDPSGNGQPPADESGEPPRETAFAAAGRSRSVGEARYEVVFAVDVPSGRADANAADNRDGAAASAIAAVADSTPTGLAEMNLSLSRMRRDLSSIGASVYRSELAARIRDLPGPQAAAGFAQLREAGFSEAFSLELVRGDSPEPNGIRFELNRRLTCSPGLGRLAGATRGLSKPVPGPAQKIVAIAGIAGSGKTSVCAKLAALHGIARHRSTHLLSIDSGRVGGSDLLRAFAGLLGAAFTVLDSPRALPSTLDLLRHAELILIDTPGLRSHPNGDSEELAEALNARPDIETQLVLPAMADRAGLLRQLDAFAMFAPSRLILTHTDEAARFGAILEAVACSNLPVSFLSTGPSVPDDFEPARNSKLIELALGQADEGFETATVREMPGNRANPLDGPMVARRAVA